MWQLRVYRMSTHNIRCSLLYYKFTFARKGVKQIRLQSGQEVTLSYNTKIQRVPVDNVQSTRHLLKRERQSADVLEAQGNRRKQRLAALRSEISGLSSKRSLRSRGCSFLISDETQRQLQQQLTLRGSMK